MNLEQVYDPDDICYEFSENLFSQDGLDRVTNHLGISDLPVDSRSPNPSPSLFTVPDDVRIEIVRFYRDTYLAVIDRFGDVVKFHWRKSYELL